MLKKVFIACLFINFIGLNAQIDTISVPNVISNTPGLVADTNSLLDGLEDEEIDYVSNTFKGTRVINSQSIEMFSKAKMDYRISHRFGTLDGGLYTLYGLD